MSGVFGIGNFLVQILFFFFPSSFCEIKHCNKEEFFKFAAYECSKGVFFKFHRLLQSKHEAIHRANASKMCPKNEIQIFYLIFDVSNSV